MGFFLPGNRYAANGNMADGNAGLSVEVCMYVCMYVSVHVPIKCIFFCVCMFGLDQISVYFFVSLCVHTCQRFSKRAGV